MYLLNLGRLGWLSLADDRLSGLTLRLIGVPLPRTEGRRLLRRASRRPFQRTARTHSEKPYNTRMRFCGDQVSERVLPLSPPNKCRGRQSGGEQPEERSPLSGVSAPPRHGIAGGLAEGKRDDFPVRGALCGGSRRLARRFRGGFHMCPVLRLCDSPHLRLRPRVGSYLLSQFFHVLLQTPHALFEGRCPGSPAMFCVPVSRDHLASDQPSTYNVSLHCSAYRGSFAIGDLGSSRYKRFVAPCQFRKIRIPMSRSL